MSDTVKIVLRLHTGYCGMDGIEFYELHKPYTKQALEDFCFERARSHAEMYGIYPYPEDEEVLLEDSENQYSYNIDGWYELYDPVKHGNKVPRDGLPQFDELYL